MKRKVKNIEDVPEALRAEYEKTGDWYTLKLDGDGEIRDPDAVLERNKELLAEVKRQKAALAKLEGVDPEKYQKLAREAEEREAKRALEAGEFETLKKSLIEKHAEDRKKDQAEIQRRDKFIRKIVAEREALEAITAAGPRNAATTKVLLPHVLDGVEVVEENDEWVARIRTPRGDGFEIADGTGRPLGLKDRVAKMKDDEAYADFFAGNGSSGGGAPARRGTTGNEGPAGAGKARQIVIRSEADLLANIEAINKGEVVIVDG